MLISFQADLDQRLQTAQSLNALTSLIFPERKYFLGEEYIERGELPNIGQELMTLARAYLVGEVIPLYVDEWSELLDEATLESLKRVLETSSADWQLDHEVACPPHHRILPGMYIKLKESELFTDLTHPLSRRLAQQLSQHAMFVTASQSGLVHLRTPNLNEVTLPADWVTWVPDQALGHHGMQTTKPALKVGSQLLSYISSKRLEEIAKLERFMVKPVTDAEVREITSKAGDWVTGYDVSEDRPSEFGGYFMICEETGHGLRGSIVKGNDWDFDDQPQWRLVHGFTLDNSKWYAQNSGMAYLGKKLDTRWLDISDHLCFGNAKHKSLQHVSARKSAASISTSSLIADFSEIRSKAGDWVDGCDVSEEEPSQFSAGLFMFCGSSSWYARGTIVRGEHWDHSTCPKWKLVHGKSKGDGEWYEGNSEMCYLGATLTDALLNLSDELCSETDDDEYETVDGRGTLPLKAEKIPSKSSSSRPFEVGDQVRVKPSVASPRYGWGEVKHEDVGLVSQIRKDLIKVDFEKQKSWSADPDELELLDSAGRSVERGLNEFSENPSFVYGEIWNILTRLDQGERWEQIPSLTELREKMIRFSPQQHSSDENEVKPKGSFAEQDLFSGMIRSVQSEDDRYYVQTKTHRIDLTDAIIPLFEQLSGSRETSNNETSTHAQLEKYLDQVGMTSPLGVLRDVAEEMLYRWDASESAWISNNGPVELRIPFSSQIAVVNFTITGNTSFGFGLMPESFSAKGDLVSRGVGWVNSATSGDYLTKTPSSWAGKPITLSVNTLSRTVSAEAGEVVLRTQYPVEWTDSLMLCIGTWAGGKVVIDTSKTEQHLNKKTLQLSPIEGNFSEEDFYFSTFVTTRTAEGDSSAWNLYRGYRWSEDEPLLFKQLAGDNVGSICSFEMGDLLKVSRV